MTKKRELNEKKLNKSKIVSDISVKTVVVEGDEYIRNTFSFFNLLTPPSPLPPPLPPPLSPTLPQLPLPLALPSSLPTN
ncbi:unnamed protein product [Thelazia callipaeda]|uniref:Uncharacterized protein n=1 Tax=Thelazia callipaeda TaxID=103827 RepID=A0A0N5CZ69_THECL|nr:unnamed protein product [Thelazia callipaeda]